jgi:ABC-type amino acid transport substrate-binding protein
MLTRALVASVLFAFACLISTPPANAQAPGPAPALAQEGILQKIQRTKVIHAGYIPYPPFAIVDPATKKLSGYFIELMDTIVAEMGQGIKIEYEETTWGTMVVSAQSGKFDMVVSGILSTIPRDTVTLRPVMLLG